MKRLVIFVLGALMMMTSVEANAKSIAGEKNVAGASESYRSLSDVSGHVVDGQGAPIALDMPMRRDLSRSPAVVISATR